MTSHNRTQLPRAAEATRDPSDENVMGRIKGAEWRCNVAMGVPDMPSHNHTELSLEHNTNRPSNKNLMDTTEWSCSMAIGAPDIPSHNHTERSKERDAKRDPSGENITDEIGRQWPRRVAMEVPDVTSHNRTVQSLEPDASRDPSGEYATESTEPE